jgi:predicted metal-binding membrane protein
MASSFETTVPAGRSSAAGDRALRAGSSLLFLASAAATVLWCGSMSGSMPMTGGWSMSMAWMRMPGQTWPGAGATFLGMWIVMMAAMMLPSLYPALSSYGRSIRDIKETSSLGLTAIAAAGYFFVWAVLGAAAYPLGVAVTAAEMRSPALARLAPFATGAVLLAAGIVQLTAWKARQLRFCREAPCGPAVTSASAGAWKHGLRLGARCAACCAGFMTVLLVLGVMNLAVMAVVAAAITAERWAPRPERAARVTGALAMAAGLFFIARALRLA